MTFYDSYCRRRTRATWFGTLSLGLVLGGPLTLNAGETFTQQPTVAASQVRATIEAKPEASAPDRASLDQGPKPTWIWGLDANRQYVLTKEFDGGSKYAWLKASSDNRMTLFVNGQRVAASDEWQTPIEVDIQKHLQPGKNVLRAEVANAGGIAAFACKLALTMPDGEVRYVVSDESWKAVEKGQPDQPVALRTFGKMGVQPWGDVFSKPVGLVARDRDVFNVPEGFQVELLYTVPKETLGSWVNITADPQGRLIVSDQGNLGLCRVTPPAIGSNGETKVERLDVKSDGKLVSGAHGLLYAFDSLYVVCNGGPGSGLYRCQDTNGDDQFDKVEKLRDIPGGGEHGPHAIRLSPDGKSLFIAAGNHTHLPFQIKTNAPPQTMGGPRSEQLRATLPEGLTSRLMPNWDEDLLLPRQWDGGGHAAGVLAPGGWICQVDPDGKNWEVFSSGYRNEFDFAFNADGEMFAYDADMEWDIGSPWYRPTRVVHATSGSEFGWRSGTGKWPSYYIDSLPELINIGPGSPVGVEFGYGTKFPAKYQRALYLCDWTFGTMYAIHMEPSGSSYTATKEEFLSRTPLPLTDCTVGKDGALYFTIGGRGAQSELYRVTYVGREDTKPVDARTPTIIVGAKPTLEQQIITNFRQVRRPIEGFHVGEYTDPVFIPLLLQRTMHLEDRQIAYAARVALERMPIKTWLPELLATEEQLRLDEQKMDNTTLRQAYSGFRYDMIIECCVALARQADPDLLPTNLRLLSKVEFGQLNERQQLGLLRAYQLALIRLGSPDEQTCAALTKKFDDLFPQKSDFVNRELAILMIHFQSPNAANKLVPLLAQERVASQKPIGELLSRNSGYGGTIAAMLANQPDQQQYFYAFNLRNLKAGWTLDLRKTYFAWFNKARTWSGGASYPKFLTNIDNEAFANCTDTERLAIEASGVRKPYVAPELPKPIGPGHEYTVDEVIAMATDKLRGRDFKNGEKMYKAARCVVCHRFGGDGGATGPDLTQLAGRFNLKDLTDAIVDPSKVISDQFRASVVVTTGGQIYAGLVFSKQDGILTVLTDPEDISKVVKVPADQVDEVTPSKVSLMPKDLLKTLNQDEVLDLLAYLLSRGNPGDAMFKK